MPLFLSLCLIKIAGAYKQQIIVKKTNACQTERLSKINPSKIDYATNFIKVYNISRKINLKLKKKFCKSKINVGTFWEPNDIFLVQKQSTDF